MAVLLAGIAGQCFFISHREPLVVDRLPSSKSRRQRIAGLRALAPAVLPSMLLCDFANLQQEVERLEAAGVEGLHLDVMDGHFVPNLTYGPPLVAAFRRLTDLPLDVHLMISEPNRYLDEFAAAGADSLTIHIETVPQPGDVLQRIRALGAAAGLALNPSTPLDAVLDYLPLCDLLLVMSVEPGFGGQSFEPVALEKLSALREQAPSELLLEVDGGVNDTTIDRCSSAGAELLVVGSAIFRHKDYKARVGELTRLARQHEVQRD